MQDIHVTNSDPDDVWNHESTGKNTAKTTKFQAGASELDELVNNMSSLSIEEETPTQPTKLIQGNDAFKEQIQKLLIKLAHDDDPDMAVRISCDKQVFVDIEHHPFDSENFYVYKRVKDNDDNDDAGLVVLYSVRYNACPSVGEILSAVLRNHSVQNVNLHTRKAD